MNTSSIAAAALAARPAEAAPDAKRKGAAQQFESLLIAQILKSCHHTEPGADQSGQSAMDYAEEQFASVIAANGGLGLAKMIDKGLADQKLHD
jgi:Rod binding domain-containing protein